VWAGRTQRVGVKCGCMQGCCEGVRPGVRSSVAAHGAGSGEHEDKQIRRCRFWILYSVRQGWVWFERTFVIIRAIHSLHSSLLI